MNLLKKYKSEARQIFLISIRDDLNCWTKLLYKDKDDFFSPEYNNFKFNICTKCKNLYLYKSDGTDVDFQFVLKYKFLFFILDFKVWKSARILKNHFKNKEVIEFFKDGITELQKNFIKEVRKEKLSQIKKSI